MANPWVDRFFGACLAVAALIQVASIWGFDYGLSIWSPWAYLVLGVFIFMAAPRRGPRGARGSGPKVRTYVFLAILVLIVAVLEILETLGVFSLGFSFVYSWIMLLLGIILALAPSRWNTPANYNMYGQP